MKLSQLLLPKNWKISGPHKCIFRPAVKHISERRYRTFYTLTDPEGYERTFDAPLKQAIPGINQTLANHDLPPCAKITLA